LTAKPMPTLAREIARLATRLINFDCGGLVLYLSHLGGLEVKAAFGLPATLVLRAAACDEGRHSESARGGPLEVEEVHAGWPDHDPLLASFDLQTVIGIPLKRPSGEVEAVLFVATKTAREVTEADRDILGRFAAQAMLALQISRSSTTQQRTHNQLE